MGQPAERLKHINVSDSLYDTLEATFEETTIQQAITTRREEIQDGFVQTCGFFPIKSGEFVPHIEKVRRRREQIIGIIREYGAEAYVKMVIQELRNS